MEVISGDRRGLNGIQNKGEEIMKNMVLAGFAICFLSVSAHAKELQCFVSTTPGEEIELPQNEMVPQKGYEHLKGQNFYKEVAYKDGTHASISFQLRSKGGNDFDFRIQTEELSQMSHVTGALDGSDMFQYTDYGKGLAVKCMKDL